MRKSMPLSKLSPTERLHQISLPIYAVTGGIGSGKSTFCKLLEKEGLPVVYADKLIKQAYDKDDVRNYIQAEVPQGFSPRGYDFAKIREAFLDDQKIQADLEKLLYSHLPQLFTAELKSLGAKDFVFYEIPLVFEKDLTAFFDAIICVDSPLKVRLERVMQRDGVNAENAQAIIDLQLPLSQKANKSDYVIHNDSSSSNLALQIPKLLNFLAISSS